MITDRYDPVNIFELLPDKLELEMDPLMSRLGSLPDDEVLLARLKEDLAKRPIPTPKPKVAALPRLR